MQKYNSKLPQELETKSLWFEILLIKLETRFVFYYYHYRDIWSQKSRPWKAKLKRNWVKIVILLLVFGVIGNYTFLNIRQSVRNVEQNKFSLLEKIKSIINKNDQDQIAVLNELETKLIQDLEPIATNPLIGFVVKSDITKIKTLTAKWLDILYPFKNYKLGTNGFESTLLQQRYFTQDVELFLNKAQPLINETQSQLGGFWIYTVFGNNQVKESLQIISNVVDIISILSQKQEIILTMLGHYQTQKIVVFNQNNGEARPTGGFMGSYIPIDISRGQIQIGQSQSIYFFDKGDKTDTLAHPAMAYYGFFEGRVDPHGVRNSNVFPCFPDTAKYLEREFTKTENGYNIDNLIMTSPDYLLGYLPDSFELDINGQKVPKNQILKKIEQITAIEIEDKQNPKKQITSIFNLIINQLPEILKGQALINLISYTQESLQARNLHAWFRNDKIQQLWQTTGMAGINTCQNLNSNPIISPIVINLSGDKRNLITSTDFKIITDKDLVTIRWTQSLPPDKDNLLQRGFNKDGITMIGFQIPAQWQLQSITSTDKLIVPFLRNYYLQQLENQNQTKYGYPPEIQSLINSSFDFSQSNHDKGFSYLQPDGSRLVGLYIYDDFAKEKVSAEFEIQTKDTNNNIVFYSQPGLNLLSVTTDNIMQTDKIELQKGIKIANNPK
jgi:Protein of unknown function (DUF4012)